MKKYLVSLLMMLAMTMQAQTYDQLWKEVDQSVSEDLPKSAIAEAQRIYDKAKAERNVPQMMKAHLMIMTCRGNISPDSIPVDVKGLEAWAESPELEVHEKAVLYSILGGVHIGKDFERGDRYLKLSLQDSLALINYPAGKMVPMVQSMNTSRLYMADNLLDLLARRAAGLWRDNQWRTEANEVQKTISQTYRMLARQYERNGNRAAWVLTALDAYPNASEGQLKQWIAEYGDLDVCAEVYLKLAGDYQLKRAERIALLREAVKRYPRYHRINALKNEEKELSSPHLDIRIDAYPGEAVGLTVHYRELKGFVLKFYRLDLPIDSEMLRRRPADDLKKYGKLFSQEHIALEPTPDFEDKRVNKKGRPMPEGIYYWEAIPDGHKNQVQGNLIRVTSVGLVYQNLHMNRLRLTTVDIKSGHPIPHVEIVRYEEKNNQWERKESYRTNEFGGLVINTRTGYYQARLKNDSAMVPVRIWKGSSDRGSKMESRHHVRLFTDRSVYRPGQKVHYSGLVYGQLKDSVWIKPEEKYKVALWNADRKEVAQQEVTTDEFGTFNGTFELPETGTLGVCQLKAGQETMAFRVEAYKRPTFQVLMDTVRTNYQAGDSIQVKGRAYTFAGIPVQGATVKYKIHSKGRNWRGARYSIGSEEGETMTDAQGMFEIPVRFLNLTEDFEVVDYEVSADVTNLSGETQNGSVTLPLGISALLLDIADWGHSDTRTMLKEERKPLKFKVTNLQGFPVSAEVDYRVYPEKEDKVDDKTLGDCVLQAKAKSNHSFVPEALYALLSGTYRLKVTVWDEKGRKNEREVSVNLFSERDERIPCNEPLWVYQPQTEFDENGEAVFYYGTRAKDVTLILDRFSEYRTLGVRHLHVSNSLLTFRCKYQEEWGNGLKVVLAFVKDGKIYNKLVEIKKPQPKKQLEIQWKTFRDKLCPGGKEQWTLKISRPDGTPVDARLLATMYDASLDALFANNWFFRLNYDRTIMGVYGPYWQMRSQGQSSGSFSFPVKRLPYDGFWYSRLFEPYQWPIAVTGTGKRKAAVAFTGAFQENRAAAFPTVACEADLEEEYILNEPETFPTPRPQVKFRENFAETAFFYPQLRTDANGEVDIEFTLPESLTEWKFMGMAHTKDMFYGNITEKVVARKEFMLQPNLPRFVRVGDQVTLAASLVNISDKEVEGTVKLELSVPETGKVVLTQECPFEVKAHETGKVSFAFEAMGEHEGLVVRMVADGDTFSDGEQRYLPILSNKQKLTESVLLNAHGKGTFTYSLESLFNHHSKSVTRPQMWVEFTGNPLWYAIQSLKVVGNPENDNVLSWASAYYANALLAHLRKSEPRIADSLKVDDMDARLTEAVLKLKDLQNPDGSWSWFKGMSGNRYMTISVTQLLARLQRMTGGLADDEVVKMCQRAWTYLNKEMKEEVRWMKDAEKKGAKHIEPSEAALQCLYADALNNQGLSLDVRRYLIGRLEKMSADLTIYGKALSAIILQNAGKVDKADKFIQSLMEYSVTNEEMGRYFDSPKAHYSWFSYRIPTQVAAIEALSVMKKDTEDVEPMKQWLLKQKQAQVWENPIATTDAVYALLMTGEDWLAHTGESEIRIGKEKIRIRESEPLNLVNRKVQGNVTDIRKVTLKKESEGIAWGAVYAEFEEEVDNVNAQDNALKISRLVYKGGRPLAEGTFLQVGDRLTVRLKVSADRDMDFVQIKDGRAACVEPLDALSGYRWKDGMGYYRETKDSSMSFYLDRMRKGTYELDYEVYVTSSGVYQQGIATVRSVYAPEFGGHGKGGRLMVK